MTTLLLVEDESDIAAVLADALDLYGYTVVLASGGHDALDRARKHRPALVITDLMMPGMDGRELIWRLREIPGFEALPVIAISAAPYAGDELFLRKPFDVKDLVSLVERTIAAHRA